MYVNASPADPVIVNDPSLSMSAPEPKLASVSHVALDAIAAAIWGSPFHDTEFVVKHKGKDQSLFLHSSVAKRACPVLFRKMQTSNSIELDAMEVAETKRTAQAGRGGVRPGGTSSTARAADDEILLSDEDSEDSFDDASINDTETIASSIAPATAPLGRSQPSSFSPTGMSSRNESTTSLSAGRPNTQRSTSLFTKFMKRGNNPREDFMHSSGDAANDESGRLRRYSANTEETGPGGVPASTSGNVGASRAPIRGGASAFGGASVQPNAEAGLNRNPGQAPVQRPKNTRSAPTPPSKAGVKQIRVTGATPRSVQALIFYLYTSQVHFVSSPHQSPHSDATSLHEEASELLGDGSKQNPSLWPPAFSSKAAYCLGQQLDLPDLCLRAFDHLSLNLSTRTVLADLLSPFGDRFAEVQRAHLDFITLHWEEVKTRPDFAPTIENLVHGQYPNSSKSLFQLFSKLSIRSF
ncbi:hypothetical protein MPSI1_002047 [Malassezia psittaci]|uniref:BTB domain-containing protein n=1 Tax=Malassezia psittaci TaxID=1821823 RepID=A0AAF0F5E7_9BASI|nr:hypothetical protein MPSI1_002047 [Malassezia psittaci]